MKAKAYLDLTERKNKGETIDSNKIKKHKNDIFRMFNLLTPETKISLLPGMILDMNSFIDAIRDQRIDLDNLIGSTITLQEIIDEIENIYMLK